MLLKDTIVNGTVELITRVIVVTCPQSQLAARVTREGLSPKFGFIDELDNGPKVCVTEIGGVGAHKDSQGGMSGHTRGVSPDGTGAG